MNPRTHRIAIVASSMALTLMVTSAATAYVLLSPARRWFSTPREITVDSRGVASVTDGDGGVNDTIAAINWWNGGGALNVVHPVSGAVVYSLGDGRSDMIFGDPLRICKGTCLAATTTGYYNSASTGVCMHSSGDVNVVEITDSDVAFNLSYAYTTPTELDGCSQEIYLDSVAAHEAGHVIGLGHSNSSAALMYASVAYCSHKVVVSDDTAGRNQLYNCTSFTEGGGGSCMSAASACTTNSDCCSNSCKGKPGSKTCK
jgi:Matrixin